MLLRNTKIAASSPRREPPRRSRHNHRVPVESLDVPVVLMPTAQSVIFKKRRQFRDGTDRHRRQSTVVHVGMSGGLADELSSSTICWQAKTAAAISPKRRSGKPRCRSEAGENGERQWSGRSWQVVHAVDPRSGIATAVDLDGRTICVDVAGKTREFRIEGGDGIVRSANPSAADRRESLLLTFGDQASPLTARRVNSELSGRVGRRWRPTSTAMVSMR